MGSAALSAVAPKFFVSVVRFLDGGLEGGGMGPGAAQIATAGCSSFAWERVVHPSPFHRTQDFVPVRAWAFHVNWIRRPFLLSARSVRTCGSFAIGLPLMRLVPWRRSGACMWARQLALGFIPAMCRDSALLRAFLEPGVNSSGECFRPVLLLNEGSDRKSDSHLSWRQLLASTNYWKWCGPPATNLFASIKHDWLKGCSLVPFRWVVVDRGARAWCFGRKNGKGRREGVLKAWAAEERGIYGPTADSGIVDVLEVI